LLVQPHARETPKSYGCKEKHRILEFAIGRQTGRAKEEWGLDIGPTWLHGMTVRGTSDHVADDF
jgi:hypothetical protein